MSSILWDINSVKVNVPDVYSAEYPDAGITVSCGVSSEEIAKNTGKVKYVFCVKYNDGLVLCDDYAIDKDGKVTFDLPVGVSCELVGNTMTVKKKDEPQCEVKQLKLIITNNRADPIYFYGTFSSGSMVGGLQMYVLLAGKTKEVIIPFNINSNGARTHQYGFMSVAKDSTPPVFSDVFTAIQGKLTVNNTDIYRFTIPYTFTGDELTCTVT